MMVRWMGSELDRAWEVVVEVEVEVLGISTRRRLPHKVVMATVVLREQGGERAMKLGGVVEEGGGAGCVTIVDWKVGTGGVVDVASGTVRDVASGTGTTARGRVVSAARLPSSVAAAWPGGTGTVDGMANTGTATRPARTEAAAGESGAATISRTGAALTISPSEGDIAFRLEPDGAGGGVALMGAIALSTAAGGIACTSTVAATLVSATGIACTRTVSGVESGVASTWKKKGSSSMEDEAGSWLVGGGSLLVWRGSLFMFLFSLSWSLVFELQACVVVGKVLAGTGMLNVRGMA
jgi:hypothetical protein